MARNVFGKVSHESDLRWTGHPLAVLVWVVFTAPPARRRGEREDVDRQRIIAATCIAVDVDVNTFITAEFATSFPPTPPFTTATATTITATAITTTDTTNDISDIVTTVPRERRRWLDAALDATLSLSATGRVPPLASPHSTHSAARLKVPQRLKRRTTVPGAEKEGAYHCPCASLAALTVHANNVFRVRVEPSPCIYCEIDKLGKRRHLVVRHREATHAPPEVGGGVGAFRAEVVHLLGWWCWG